MCTNGSFFIGSLVVANSSTDPSGSGSTAEATINPTIITTSTNAYKASPMTPTQTLTITATTTATQSPAITVKTPTPTENSTGETTNGQQSTSQFPVTFDPNISTSAPSTINKDLNSKFTTEPNSSSATNDAIQSTTIPMTTSSITTATHISLTAVQESRSSIPTSPGDKSFPTTPQETPTSVAPVPATQNTTTSDLKTYTISNNTNIYPTIHRNASTILPHGISVTGRFYIVSYNT